MARGTCAPSVRTSSPTSWRSCCTRNRSRAAPPGPGSSTRPSGAALPHQRARSSPTPRRSIFCPTRAAPRARLRQRQWARCSARTRGSSRSITNTLAKDKEIEDRWRGFARPISSRNLANFVEDEVVDALIVGRARRLSAPVASLLPPQGEMVRGRGAAVLGPQRAVARRGRPPRCRGARHERIVLDAYGAFSPDMAAIGKRFFEHPWIDAPVRPGKASGAFAHPTVPSVHPYLLLNYQGRARDVMTLAHELGHGVHQVLAGPQGPADGRHAADPGRDRLGVRRDADLPRPARARNASRAGARSCSPRKVEDMLNTVVRQIAFVTFETRVHDERRAGELTPERIGEIWLDVQRESLGPAIRFEDEYRWYWTYIPHFIHTPFYVYAYAFGDCLVNSLYAVYRARTGLRRAISRHAARRRRQAPQANCWRRSGSTRPTPASGRRAWRWSPASSTNSKRWADAPWPRTTTSAGRMRRYAAGLDRDGRARGAARGRALSRRHGRPRRATPPI